MSSLRPSPQHEFRQDDGAPPPAGAERPLWPGILLGLVLATGILAFVLNWRAKHNGVTLPPTATAVNPTTKTGPPPSVARPMAAPSTSAGPLPIDKVVVHPVVHPAASSSAGKTAERIAVDALHSGDVARAAQVYAELAAANPDNPALVEAARQLGIASRGAKAPR